MPDIDNFETKVPEPKDTPIIPVETTAQDDEINNGSYVNSSIVEDFVNDISINPEDTPVDPNLSQLRTPPQLSTGFRSIIFVMLVMILSTTLISKETRRNIADLLKGTIRISKHEKTIIFDRNISSGPPTENPPTGKDGEDIIISPTDSLSVGYNSDLLINLSYLQSLDSLKMSFERIKTGETGEYPTIQNIPEGGISIDHTSPTDIDGFIRFTYELFNSNFEENPKLANVIYAPDFKTPLIFKITNSEPFDINANGVLDTPIIVRMHPNNDMSQIDLRAEMNGVDFDLPDIHILPIRYIGEAFSGESGTLRITATGPNNQSDHIDVQIEYIPPANADEEAITEVSFEEPMTVSPNPATSDQIKIVLNSKEIPNSVKLRIYNIGGQKLIEKTLNNYHGDDVIVNISDLPSGVYLVKLEGKKFQKINKFIRTK